MYAFLHALAHLGSMIYAFLHAPLWEQDVYILAYSGAWGAGCMHFCMLRCPWGAGYISFYALGAGCMHLHGRPLGAGFMYFYVFRRPLVVECIHF